MNSVRIDAPYGVDDVKAPKDKLKMLEQFKKIVGGEKRKMATNSGTPPNGARKGG